MINLLMIKQKMQVKYLLIFMVNVMKLIIFIFIFLFMQLFKNKLMYLIFHHKNFYFIKYKQSLQFLYYHLMNLTINVLIQNYDMVYVNSFLFYLITLLNNDLMLIKIYLYWNLLINFYPFILNILFLILLNLQ